MIVRRKIEGVKAYGDGREVRREISVFWQWRRCGVKVKEKKRKVNAL